MYANRGRFVDLPDGENSIPLAPTLTATGGVSLVHPSGWQGSVRFRHVNERPAIEDNSIQAHGWTVVDLTASYSVEFGRIGIAVENILNVKWNEAQFETTSRLRNEPAPVSELNFTPGTPFAVKASVAWFFR